MKVKFINDRLRAKKLTIKPVAGCKPLGYIIFEDGRREFLNLATKPEAK